MQACLVGRAREPNHTVEALVIGQGKAGQTQLDGTLNQVLDARGAIEEREIRVAMELGEGTSHYPIIERLF